MGQDQESLEITYKIVNTQNSEIIWNSRETQLDFHCYIHEEVLTLNLSKERNVFNGLLAIYKRGI